ncbi:MAG: hypothetical protein QOF30_1788 [Acidimicrobiaceae bacterium]|nr:hypothetical protein [Acidimicrobiaceae bacterium]
MSLAGARIGAMNAQIDREAARQLGLVTLRQLRTIGMTDAQVRHWSLRGALVCVRPEVYRLAGAPVTWEQAVLAVALSAGPDVVISHTTAAAVWDLRHSDRHRAGIHVSGERRIRIHGVTGHQIPVSKAERTVTRSIPVTTVERTIVDLAGSLTVTQLGQCVDDAIRRRLLSLDRLRTLVDDAALRGGRRLRKPLHQVLADRIPGYRPDDSDFETRMNLMWDRLGLPDAKRQYRITVDGHSYRLDRAIVEQRIGTEWDSYAFHSAPSDRDHDSDRRARLVGDGWLIIPVTANSTPELVARAVLRAYRDRGGEGRLTA